MPVFQGNYVSAWFKAAESIKLLNQLTTTLIMGLNALIIFIWYIKNNMLVLYLPVGLILRSFQQTRGIGAFFIAIAIGFFFVFPVVFMLTDPGFHKIDLPPGGSDSEPLLCYPTYSGVAKMIDEGINPSQEMTEALFSITEGASILAKVYTLLFIQPLVALAITLVFVRYMMLVLGGEPYDIMRAVARMI
jgi:hypothetical protein